MLLWCTIYFATIRTPWWHWFVYTVPPPMPNMSSGKTVSVRNIAIKTDNLFDVACTITAGTYVLIGRMYVGMTEFAIWVPLCRAFIEAREIAVHAMKSVYRDSQRHLHCHRVMTCVLLQFKIIKRKRIDVCGRTLDH